MSDADVVNDQVNIANGMVAALRTQQEIFTQINEQLQHQATLFNDLILNLNNVTAGISDLNNSLTSMSERLNDLSNIDTSQVFGNSSQINSRMNSHMRNIVNMMNGNEIIHQNLQEASQQAQNAANETAQLSRQAQNTVQTVEDTVVVMEEGVDELENETSRLKALASMIGGIGIVARAIQTFGFSLLVDIPKLIFSGVQIAANLATTAFGILFNVYKTVLTLPFTIANNFIGAGNAIRQKIDESMANSLESVKENFDLSSSIGKGAAKTKKALEGRLVEFENKSSELFKQFESPEGVIDYLNTTTAGLGMYSEVFGGTLTSSIENIEYMKKMQSTLGLSTEHLKYYAMEAYNNVEPINNMLDRVLRIISTTAEKNNIDKKRLSSVFNKLRTNIIDFGHISHITLSEISAKIIKYKISAEDVAGIFGKFTSYEDAANTSAQLFQSFGMVVDAYDLIASENPIDIIEMMRESMFNTGRDFASLNRHEKSYLKNLVGISEQSMAAIFSYENISMSHEEIRRKMSSENPAEIQIKSLKEMTSAIKVFRKVVTYESPFSALYAGLMENSATNVQMKKVTMELSSAFEKLNQMILGLDDKTIENISIPLTLILRDFSKMVTDGTLVRIFTNATAGIGQLFLDIFATASKSKTDDLISQTLSLNDAVSTLIGEKSKDLQQSILESYKKVFKELKDNNDFIKAAKEKGLLDKDGNLNTDDINTIGSFLITSLNSNNTALAEAVGAQSELFLAQLEAAKKIIKESADNETGNLKATLDHLSSANHYDTIIAMLNVRIGEMFKDGSPLMERMFNLGRTIAGGIYKGFFDFITSTIEALSGKKGLISKMFPASSISSEEKFAKLLGFKDYSEYDQYMSNLKTSITNLFEKHKGKLWDGFKFITSMLWDIAGDIFNLVKDSLISIASGVYYSEDIGYFDKIALWSILPKETRKKLFLKKELDRTRKNDSISITRALSNLRRKEIIGNEEYDFKSNDDLLSQFNNSLSKLGANFEIESKNTSQKQSATEIYKKATLAYGTSADEQMLFIKQYRTHFLTLVNSLRDQQKKNTLKNITETFFKKKSPTKNDISTFFDFMTSLMSLFAQESLGSKNTKLMYVDDIKPDSTNDLKLHEKDKGEFIASKQGGMLMSLYDDIKNKYNNAVLTVKSVLNNDIKEFNLDEELTQITEIIDNLCLYIDNSNNKKRNIVNNKTKVVG